jgi:regulator of sirC expression with transglutaminase-like and TPR domain
MEPAERFATLVAGPEADLRLDVAALCISASVRPDIDIDAQCARIDELAAGCASGTFDAVREHLFGTEHFRGDSDDYRDPRNSFLDAVIDRRRGIPITLSVLLIEIARRRGVDVVGVGMPGHFLTREVGAGPVWCDAFHGGALLDRDACARLFDAVHGGARRLEDTDLAPTPPRAILARMLANLESGPLAGAPRAHAAICALHLTIPGLPLELQLQLLRGIAHGGDPERVQRAYSEVASRAPDPLASKLRAEARVASARWN